jgi:WD40 repeat protein
VWDAESGAELAVLRGHEDEVTSVSYSPDGARIASVSAEPLAESEDHAVRLWDARSGECLDVIQGSEDVRAIAAGSQAFPLRAQARGLEYAVERVDSGRPVAWFPVTFLEIVIHPSGRTWAGASANHLYIITLEGGDTLRAGNEPLPLPATSR